MFSFKEEKKKCLLQIIKNNKVKIIDTKHELLKTDSSKKGKENK